MQDCVNGYSSNGAVVSDTWPMRPTSSPWKRPRRSCRVGRNQAYELARVWRATGGERGVPVVEFGRLLRVPKAALLRLAGLAEPLGAERGA